VRGKKILGETTSRGRHEGGKVLGRDKSPEVPQKIDSHTSAEPWERQNLVSYLRGVSDERRGERKPGK